MEKFKSIKELPHLEIGTSGTIIRRGKILKHHSLPVGYRQIRIRYNGIKINRYVHRLVALAWIENPQNKLEVNHKDGIKSNNNYENLEWVTRSENTKHSFRVLGRKPVSGSAHPFYGVKKDLSGIKNPNHKLYALWEGNTLILEDFGGNLAKLIHCSVSAISLSVKGQRGLIYKKYHVTKL